MIKSFKHRGLRIFHEGSNGKLLNPDHLKRIRRLLDALDAISDVSSLIMREIIYTS